MSIIDSKTGKIKKDYTVEELIEKAKEMRAYNMVAITAAGSGHTGGTLSIMDITTALYLNKIKHNPANQAWEEIKGKKDISYELYWEKLEFDHGGNLKFKI